MGKSVKRRLAEQRSKLEPRGWKRDYRLTGDKVSGDGILSVNGVLRHGSRPYLRVEDGHGCYIGFLEGSALRALAKRILYALEYLPMTDQRKPADEIEALICACYEETDCSHSEARHIYLCADCLGPKIERLRSAVAALLREVGLEKRDDR